MDKENNHVYWYEGNNAEPIHNGRCCDPCNQIVVAERIDIQFKFIKLGEKTMNTLTNIDTTIDAIKEVSSNALLNMVSVDQDNDYLILSKTLDQGLAKLQGCTWQNILQRTCAICYYTFY